MLATIVEERFAIAPQSGLEPAPTQFPSLASFLLPDSGESSSETSAPFTVDSLSKASWAAARILDAQERIAQRTDLARSYKARIDAWLTDANAPDNDSADYLHSLLKPWVEDQVARQQRSRSVLLPTATVQLRKMPDRVEVIDRDAALAYCKMHHPDAVIVREDISKTAVRSLIFTEGEAIPGIEAELGHDELYVKAIG
jgi:phage host-nuclease inhibitor protein Gam